MLVVRNVFVNERQHGSFEINTVKLVYKDFGYIVYSDAFSSVPAECFVGWYNDRCNFKNGIKDCAISMEADR